jgi:hypothetical protein
LREEVWAPDKAAQKRGRALTLNEVEGWIKGLSEDGSPQSLVALWGLAHSLAMLAHGVEKMGLEGMDSLRLDDGPLSLSITRNNHGQSAETAPPR